MASHHTPRSMTHTDSPGEIFQGDLPDSVRRVCAQLRSQDAAVDWAQEHHRARAALGLDTVPAPNTPAPLPAGLWHATTGLSALATGLAAVDSAWGFALVALALGLGTGTMSLLRGAQARLRRRPAVPAIGDDDTPTTDGTRLHAARYRFQLRDDGAGTVHCHLIRHAPRIDGVPETDSAVLLWSLPSDAPAAQIAARAEATRAYVERALIGPAQQDLRDYVVTATATDHSRRTLATAHRDALHANQGLLTAVNTQMNSPASRDT